MVEYTITPNRSEAIEALKAASRGITHTDFNPAQIVEIEHQDGSVLRLRYALFMIWHEWYLIYSEHHGNCIYHKDDVVMIRQAESISKAPDILDYGAQDTHKVDDSS